MPVYQVTTMWNQSVMGVSETFFTGNKSPTSAAADLASMLALRAQAMFQDQFFVGVRISQYGQKRSSAVILPPGGFFPGTQTTVAVPSNGTLSFSGLTARPDQLRSVLQLQFGFADSRTTLRYLSGIPDSFSATEPATMDLGGGVTWQKNLQSWLNYLVTNGWQLRGQSLPPAIVAAPVIGIVQQSAAPGLIGIVVLSATAPTFLQGSKIALQGMRAAKGTRGSTMNGTWYVDSVDTTASPGNTIIYLRGSAGIDPDAQRFTDKTTIRNVVYTTYPLQTWRFYRVGIHKRGRPSLAPRGRRLTRVSLDP